MCWIDTRHCLQCPCRKSTYVSRDDSGCNSFLESIFGHEVDSDNGTPHPASFTSSQLLSISHRTGHLILSLACQLLWKIYTYIFLKKKRYCISCVYLYAHSFCKVLGGLCQFESSVDLSGFMCVGVTDKLGIQPTCLEQLIHHTSTADHHENQGARNHRHASPLSSCEPCE